MFEPLKFFCIYILYAPQFQCSDVHNIHKDERCAFVKITDDCHIDEGFLDYTYFVYCSMSPKLLPLALILLVSTIFLWL